MRQLTSGFRQQATQVDVQLRQPQTEARDANSDHGDIIIEPRPLTISNAGRTEWLRRRLEGVRPEALLLGSDFDGTLAEITDQPAAARPLPESLAALRRLTAQLGRVVILSGRATTALERFLPVPGLRLRGDYGLAEPAPAEAAALRHFATEVAPQLSTLPGVWLEPKAASASVHFRAAPEREADALRLIAPLAERHGLRARRGRLVLEVMPARAAKDVALADEIEEMKPDGVIFAGDDTGDAACFELLSHLSLPHLAIGVASPEVTREIFAACDLVLEGPHAFADLLSDLADWAEAQGPASPESAS